MPIWLHISLAVLLEAYVIFRYIKEKSFYYILFAIWIPSTLLTYPFKNLPHAYTVGLGIFEVIMFILVIFFMFRRSGDRRMKTLDMLSKMAADSLPDEVESTPQVQAIDTPQVEEETTQQVEQKPQMKEE